MLPVTEKLEELLKNKGSGALTAFLLYEDVASCARAEEFCQELIRRVTLAQLLKRAWLCNQLRQTRLRQIAIQEAASADLVILSLHYADTLPPEVVTWLRAWLAAMPRPKLIVGLFEDDANEGLNLMREELERITSEAGISLLVQSSPVPEDGVAY